MNLTTSLGEIKGVGDKTAALLAGAGFVTVGDLIDFLPRKYEDFSEVVPIVKIRPGKMTVRAKVVDVDVQRLRGRMNLTRAVLSDGTGKINAVWFNQPYRAAQFKDDEYFFSGNFELKYGRYQLTNPSAEKAKDLPVQTGRVLPIYPARKGVKPAMTRKILDELRPLISVLPEILPGELVQQAKLLSRAQAFLQIHFPRDLKSFEAARQRLAFEDLFGVVLAAKLNREEINQLSAPQITFNQAKIKQFVDQLPFQMTGAQKRALWEILQDLDGERPMSRLLQGDVGSGKTVVGAGAAFQAYLGGYQTAFLAPTAILATQHAETLSRLLEPFGVQVALLLGGQSKGKSETLKQLTEGKIHVVVGTHALLQDAVQFHRLGLVVIDEQHRFGVNQRNKLFAKTETQATGSTLFSPSEPNVLATPVAKAERSKTPSTPVAYMPHLLAMTATPIPRSLQLTMFGDLEVSILYELPAKRRPIQTKIWTNSTRNELYDFIKQELAAGRQAYFVTSLIEPSPQDKDLKAATQVFDAMRKKFAKWRVGLLHGKLRAEEKDRVMQKFKQHELDILVSTTVIEVGVDAPNATLMVIENADRFGLAQLHQLRGRVGRGEHQSHCFIMPTDIEKVSRRLRYITESTDGFWLAEKDLELRGPGEIYGTAQHGELNLQVANLADTRLIKQVNDSVAWFRQNAKLADFPALRRQVEKAQKLTTLN